MSGAMTGQGQGEPAHVAHAAHVKSSRRGAVGLIELTRPDKFNALSRAALSSIQDALSEFEKPGSGIRAVLIHARGKHFCTGADLDEFKAMRGDTTMLRDFLEHVHLTLGRVETSPLPVVAACHGLALAGGMELMLACDIVIAAPDARFGDQHVQYGLVPAWGGSQRLPRHGRPRPRRGTRRLRSAASAGVHGLAAPSRSSRSFDVQPTQSTP